MKIEYLDRLIDKLNKDKDKTNKDEQKQIEYVINKFKRIESITEGEINKIEKILFDLDMTYDFYIDLNYYYDPIIADCRKMLKEKMIKDLRKRNRRKI